MLIKKVILFALAGAVIWFVGTAQADKRSYVWTYEYVTTPKGDIELEWWSTNKIEDTQVKEKNSWEHQFEIEYGITDHWDIALYQRWKQTNDPVKGNEYMYVGPKVETRYRFFEAGDYFVDPLLYAEYKLDSGLEDPSSTLEGKIILAKDISRVNIAFNYVLESDLDEKAVAEHKYDVGINYEIVPAFRLGAESKGKFHERGGVGLGPTLAWQSEKIFAVIGWLYPLNNDAKDLELRFIIGIPF